MTDLYVLDTSAILTYTDQEDGVVEVEMLLENARLRKCRLEVCSISLMEIYYITLRASGEDLAARLVSLVKSWPLIWVYPDEKILFAGGEAESIISTFCGRCSHCSRCKASQRVSCS